MRDLHNGTTRYVMKLAYAIRTILDSFVDGTASVKINSEGTSQLKLYGTAVNDKKEKKNVTITVNML